MHKKELDSLKTTVKQTNKEIIVKLLKIIIIVKGKRIK